MFEMTVDHLLRMAAVAWLTLGTLACSGADAGTAAPFAEVDAGDASTADAVKEAAVDGQGSEDTAPEVQDADAAGDGDVASEESSLDIYEALKAIEGMAASEEASPVSGCRFFRLVYQQPSNHQAPSGVSFGQRMALIHCSPSAPTVLGTTGYMMFSEANLWELSAMLEANQLIVEHRFFDPSIPSSPTWTDLTIQQAAADHHRIVSAIRPLYTGKWLSTGASKGGMTSVYHRRFYPDDVDGTVAYVAPQSHGIDDARYPLFLEQVGDPACRDKLKNFQREALLRKPAMLTRMNDLAAQSGLTYQWLGVEKAFEHAVTEFWFYFWQYFDASQCPDVPESTATDDDVFLFLNQISPLESVADSSVAYFSPYYYQAATQLGAPKQADAHIVDLLAYPGTDVPATYSPQGWPTVFDSTSMVDVETWLSGEGQRMMFIYGQNDPWSAAAFELGGAKDSYRFWVPEGNHGSQISGLPEPDHSQALAAIETWSGVKPKAIPALPSVHALHPRLRPPL